MRTWFMSAALALAAAALLPLQGQAQAADWWNWALPAVANGARVQTSSGAVIALPLDRDGEWERRRDREREAERRDRRGGDLGDIILGDDRDRREVGRGKGPPFCRNGAGHPVHGRRWCVEKGFGLGARDRGVIWDRAGWEDVIFRAPRRSGVYDRGSLIDILGDVVLRRLSAGAYGGADIDGRYFRASGANVLQVRAGGVPIAELSDLDADGRADVVLLARRR